MIYNDSFQIKIYEKIIQLNIKYIVFIAPFIIDSLRAGLLMYLILIVHNKNLK
jgi:hypothetical protein